MTEKKRQTQKKLLITLIFGLFGTTTEVYFTAFSNLISEFRINEQSDLTLKGESYVWMFFIYALIGPIFNFIYPLVIKFHVIIRIIFYGVAILIIEFLTGFLLEMTIGKCPWEYDSGITFFGYVRLDFIFFWMVFGFIVEKVYVLLNLRIK